MKTLGTALGVIPLLWGCLILLFILLLLLIGYLVWQARRAAQSPAATAPESAKAPQQATVGAEMAAELPESFSGAISTLRSRVTGPDFRYVLPWFLLIGAPESGKTSLLSESSLSVVLEEQVRVEQGAAMAWNFFATGIVIDVGGWAFSTAANAVSAWRRLLRLFVNHRPERPLDGILLSISAAELVGPGALTPPGLIERGALLQQRLRQITRTIGFQLPIYVILTKCDSVPGFMEFAAELESEELEQIFGWSNPHSATMAFHPEWVDEAINVMRISLERKQSRIFALHEPTDTRGTMFLFPGALHGLIPNLRLLLAKTLRGSTEEAAPMLRGIYCCGATSVHLPRATGAKMVPVSAPSASSMASAPSFATSGLSWVPSLLEPWLRSDLQIAFTQDLLLKKIFAEKGLAVPLAHHFALRDRLRVSLQLVSVAAAVLLAVGTAFAYRREQLSSLGLLPLLSTIRTDLRNPPQFDKNLDLSSHASASSLIHAMASFETDGLGSIFIPASWFDHVNVSISKAMVPAFRILVLQRFHEGLEARIRRIADLNHMPLPNAAIPPDTRSVQPALQLERTPEFLQMRGFMEQVSDLQRFVSVYNSLSTKESQAPISSIIELDQYLHNQTQPVPPSEAANPYFEQALREASWSPVIYTDETRWQMSAKASQLTTALYSAWIEHNPTRRATEQLAASVNTLSGPSRHNFAQLTDAKASFDAVGRVLAEPTLAWTGADKMEIPADLASVTTDAVVHSNLYQPWLRDWMVDLADDDFRKLASSLDEAQTPLTGNLVQADDGKLQLTERAAQVQVALENLMSLPFMSASSNAATVPMRAAARDISWNKASLDAAAALPVSYERYLAEDLDQAPSTLRSVFGRIAADQLSSSLVIAIEEAEQSAPPVISGVGPSAVSQQTQAFATVERSITTLLTTLEQNNLTIPQEQLRRASTAQASGLLSALDRELDADHPFGVATVAFSRWTNEGTPTADIFDAPTADAVAAYLAAQSERMESYGSTAVPIVTFLRQYGGGLSPQAAKVLLRWQGITTAVDQYKAKRPGNSIQLLHDFIATGADKISPAKACQAGKPFAATTVQADYFVNEASELRRDIVMRCQALLNESFTHNYNLLSAHFNRDLAGRFPFALSSSSTLYEADPQLIASVFSQRDVLVDLLTADAAKREDVRLFLGSLETSRPWFLSLLNTASSTLPPSLDFTVIFRSNRDLEVGGNQIIDWSLQVGSDSFHAGDAERKGHWTYGDPIVLSLRWAKDAPFQPVPSGKAAAGYDVEVVGDTVTYTFTDPWSLLRMVRSFALPVYNRGNGDAFTLAFEIPESAAHGAKLQPEPISSTRVFLRLQISSPGEKQTIPTNTFPEAAPVLTATQTVGE